MDYLTHLFTEHPESVGETYWMHFRSALHFSALMLIGAIGCTIHAFLPFLCTQFGSSRIRYLHEVMVTHRRDWRTRDATNQRA
jgi:hypothetical protein